MARLKNTDTGRNPPPHGSWLAGMVIGATIISMATGAMLLGAGMAVTGAAQKGG